MVSRLLPLMFALVPMFVSDLGMASETERTDDPLAVRLAEKLVTALSSPVRRERVEAEESLMILLREGRLTSVPESPLNHPSTAHALSRIRRQFQIDAAKRAFSTFAVNRTAVSSQSIDSQDPDTPNPPDPSGRIVQCTRITAVGTRFQTDPVPVPNLIHVRVRCEVSSDVRPLTLTLRDADFSLSIDGVACRPFSPDGMRELTCESQTLEFTISFQAPDSVKFERARLRGQIQLRAAAGGDVIEFPIKKKDSLPKQVGATEARLVSAEVTPFGLETRLIVALPMDMKWESYQVEGLYRNVSVATKNGTVVPANEVIVSENADGTHAIVCRFPDVQELGENDRLQFPLYALISNLELPFELSAVTLNPIHGEVKK